MQNKQKSLLLTGVLVMKCLTNWAITFFIFMLLLFLFIQTWYFTSQSRNQKILFAGCVSGNPFKIPFKILFLSWLSGFAWFL